MKGKNELQLCPAEMMRAVEYYLNEVQFKEPVKITEIEQHGSASHDFWFKITIVEQTKTETPDAP